MDAVAALSVGLSVFLLSLLQATRAVPAAKAPVMPSIVRRLMPPAAAHRANFLSWASFVHDAWSGCGSWATLRSLSTGDAQPGRYRRTRQ
jgi:hypothetical protein